uniref:Mother of FT n=1 Tax=Adiantum raddianum TaxID=32168 RepID=A0A8E7MED0_ADIRA|nr:mother of FT [Adiantum raddianum]
MSRRTEPLVVGRVIGDVIDMFAPSGLEMSIAYTTREVSNGYDIKPSAATQPPSLRMSDPHSRDSLFTLVMVDPDAPSPSEPSMREWVHWIVIDIPGRSDASMKGREVVPYMGPKPTVGIHRYVFVLFRQRGPMVVVRAPTVRHNFCTRLFAAEHGLGFPEAALYFNAQKEPAACRTPSHKRA